MGGWNKIHFDLRQATELYQKGKTDQEIAGVLECGAETVRRNLLAAGVPRRPRGYPAGKHLPNGGKTRDKSGYILLLRPKHPHANSSGYVREHRLVMEQVLGRYLLPSEVVHHEGVPKDCNVPQHLKVYDSHAEHKRDELRGNRYAAGGKHDFPRVHRSPEAHLASLRTLAANLERSIQRSDLRPPFPSYKALTRRFGSWQQAVALALETDPATTLLPDANLGPSSNDETP